MNLTRRLTTAVVITSWRGFERDWHVETTPGLSLHAIGIRRSSCFLLVKTPHTHLLQQILRAQAQNLDVAIPVANGEERRPDSVFRHLAHLEAGNLNPSQLFRAHFLQYTSTGGRRLKASAKALSTSSHLDPHPGFSTQQPPPGKNLRLLISASTRGTPRTHTHVRLFTRMDLCDGKDNDASLNVIGFDMVTDV